MGEGKQPRCSQDASAGRSRCSEDVGERRPRRRGDAEEGRQDPQMMQGKEEREARCRSQRKEQTAPTAWKSVTSPWFNNP